MSKLAFILFADGDFDQVCETRKDALRERRDLEAMGHYVRMKVVPWEKQDEYIPCS